MKRVDIGPQFRLEPERGRSNPVTAQKRPLTSRAKPLTANDVALQRRDKQLEKEYMTNLQQQVYFLEMELTMLKKAAVPKAKGLDILPDAPLDKVIFTLREKYDTMESHYKRNLRDKQENILQLQEDLTNTQQLLAKATKKLQDQVERRKKALSIAAQLKQEGFFPSASDSYASPTLTDTNIDSSTSLSAEHAEDEEEAKLAQFVRDTAKALGLEPNGVGKMLRRSRSRHNRRVPRALHRDKDGDEDVCEMDREEGSNMGVGMGTDAWNGSYTGTGMSVGVSTGAWVRQSSRLSNIEEVEEEEDEEDRSRGEGDESKKNPADVEVDEEMEGEKGVRVGTGQDPLDILAILGLSMQRIRELEGELRDKYTRDKDDEEERREREKRREGEYGDHVKALKREMVVLDNTRARLQQEREFFFTKFHEEEKRRMAAEEALRREDERGVVASLRKEQADLKKMAVDAVRECENLKYEVLMWKQKYETDLQVLHEYNVNNQLLSRENERLISENAELQKFPMKIRELEQRLVRKDEELSRLQRDLQAGMDREGVNAEIVWGLEHEVLNARQDKAQWENKRRKMLREMKEMRAWVFGVEAKNGVLSEELGRLRSEYEILQEKFRKSKKMMELAQAEARAACRDRDLLRVLCDIDPREMRILSEGAAAQLAKVGKMYRDLGKNENSEIDNSQDEMKKQENISYHHPSSTGNSGMAMPPQSTAINVGRGNMPHIMGNPYQRTQSLTAPHPSTSSANTNNSHNISNSVATTISDNTITHTYASARMRTSTSSSAGAGMGVSSPSQHARTLPHVPILTHTHTHERHACPHTNDSHVREPSRGSLSRSRSSRGMGAHHTDAPVPAPTPVPVPASESEAGSLTISVSPPMPASESRSRPGSGKARSSTSTSTSAAAAAGAAGMASLSTPISPRSPSSIHTDISTSADSNAYAPAQAHTQEHASTRPRARPSARTNARMTPRGEPTYADNTQYNDTARHTDADHAQYGDNVHYAHAGNDRIQYAHGNARGNAHGDAPQDYYSTATDYAADQDYTVDNPAYGQDVPEAHYTANAHSTAETGYTANPHYIANAQPATAAYTADATQFGNQRHVYSYAQEHQHQPHHHHGHGHVYEPKQEYARGDTQELHDGYAYGSEPGHVHAERANYDYAYPLNDDAAQGYTHEAHAEHAYAAPPEHGYGAAYANGAAHKYGVATDEHTYNNAGTGTAPTYEDFTVQEGGMLVADRATMRAEDREGVARHNREGSMDHGPVYEGSVHEHSTNVGLHSSGGGGHVPQSDGGDGGVHVHDYHEEAGYAQGGGGGAYGYGVNQSPGQVYDCVDERMHRHGGEHEVGVGVGEALNQEYGYGETHEHLPQRLHGHEHQLEHAREHEEHYGEEYERGEGPAYGYTHEAEYTDGNGGGSGGGDADADGGGRNDGPGAGDNAALMETLPSH